MDRSQEQDIQKDLVEAGSSAPRNKQSSFRGVNDLFKLLTQRENTSDEQQPEQSGVRNVHDSDSRNAEDDDQEVQDFIDYLKIRDDLKSAVKDPDSDSDDEQMFLARQFSMMMDLENYRTGQAKNQEFYQ